MGVKRTEMPQIATDDYPLSLITSSDNGATFSKETVPNPQKQYKASSGSGCRKSLCVNVNLKRQVL